MADKDMWGSDEENPDDDDDNLIGDVLESGDEEADEDPDADLEDDEEEAGSEEEANDGDEGDDDDDEYDEHLYGDEEDRKRLNAMTMKKREQIIDARYQARKERQQRKEATAQANAQKRKDKPEDEQLSKEEKKRRKKEKKKKKKKKRKRDEKKRLKKQKKRKQDEDEGEDEPLEEEEEEADAQEADEDEEAYEEEGEGDQEDADNAEEDEEQEIRARPVRTERIKNASLEAIRKKRKLREKKDDLYDEESDVAEESDVEEEEEVEEVEDEEELDDSEDEEKVGHQLTVRKAIKIQARKGTLQRFLDEPYFEQFFKDQFCRVYVGFQEQERREMYHCCQIVGVEEMRQKYRFNGKDIRKGIMVSYGKAKRIFKMSHISNHSITEDEFGRWQDRCDRDRLPRMDAERAMEIKKTAEGIRRNFRYTKDVVEQLVTEKSNRRRVPINLVRARLEVDREKSIAEIANDQPKARALMRRLENMEEYEAQAMRRRQSDKNVRLEQLNRRARAGLRAHFNTNVKKIVENRGAKREPNPFERRPTKIGERLQLTKEEIQAQEDKKKAKKEREEREVLEKAAEEEATRRRNNWALESADIQAQIDADMKLQADQQKLFVGQALELSGDVVSPSDVMRHCMHEKYSGMDQLEVDLTRKDRPVRKVPRCRPMEDAPAVVDCMSLAEYFRTYPVS